MSITITAPTTKNDRNTASPQLTGTYEIPNGTPNFDRLARIYRWMEWATFGPWLWRCRSVFLPGLHAPLRALVLGDGDGRFTARLLSQHPALLVDAVDCSSAMLLELTRRSAPNAARIQLHLADARDWQPVTEHYDLIATHFFLDCLSTGEVASLAARMKSHLTPESLWLVSEFAIPRGWFGQVAARPLISVLYWAFRLLTGLTIRRLPNHREALADAGFSLMHERRFLGGLLVSELWTPDPLAHIDDNSPTLN